MRRPSASIVIPAWNEWDLTRACLESLRPTLGVHDEVVVVDNGSRDGTAAGLARFPWVRRVTHEENLGFAAGCNGGAAVATGDVVVFLNNDTLVHGRWLDALLVPFGEADVAATGPRSNFVSGPQLVPAVSYTTTRKGELRDFARAWADEQRGRTTDVSRLVGFCIAVRREAFERVGRFDESFGIGGYEDDDLCTRLAAEGGRLLIVHDSFVHHHGHRTFDANGLDWFAVQQGNAGLYADKHGVVLAPQAGAPLVSACLIVRDEEEAIAGCLASLEGIADEVVVYDTGSVDRTRELARKAGANVIEGEWRDDFGWARNEALAHCTGSWVLHLDADEVLRADPADLHAALRRTAADGLLVAIDNQLGSAESARVVGHRACRLFRRERGRWEGRIHEQVVPHDGGAPLVFADADAASVSITHSGYLAEVMADREKSARNLRLAELHLEDASDGPARSLALLNKGRSLAGQDRHAEALACFEEAEPLERRPAARRPIIRSAVESLLELRRPADALVWLDRLREVSERTEVVDFLHGMALMLHGRNDEALALWEPLGELVDDDGLGYAVQLLHLQVAAAFAAVGRRAEAVDRLLTLVRQGIGLDVVWGPLLDLADSGDADPARVAAAVADVDLTTALGYLLAENADRADPVAEALWATHPGDARLLAYASRSAPELTSLERLLEWSARLRAAGHAADCPLVVAVADTGRRPAERLRAAAVAHSTFAEERVLPGLEDVVAVLPLGELGTALLELDALAPALLPEFVAQAATTPDRCRELADRLAEAGATDEAAVLREHAVALAG